MSRRAFLPRSAAQSTTVTSEVEAPGAAPLRTVASTPRPAALPPLVPDPAQGATGRDPGALLAHIADLHAELALVFRELSGSIQNGLADARDSRLMSDVETTTSPARLLTAADIGEMLQVSAKVIRSWRKRGAIPAGIEIGGVIRWRAEEIDAWLARGGRP